MIAFAYYLLKVIICSGVLFLYYHFALRNKLFHQWNRFYLLISVFISLIAPVVQVSIMHHASTESNKAIQMLQVFESANGYLEEVTIRGRQGMSVDQWLLIVYMLVSIILFFSILLSLKKIFSLIRSHTFQWIEKIKFINTNTQGTPFSFLNFIFWNQEIDLQTETGQQIFQHELVHVKEKHTLDKLFVQLLLVAFWSNPFFWLIRRELKLIHEFIADKKAVGEHGTAALAAMIIRSSYPTQFNSITNQFFQTSIKRRLVMLSKIQYPKINYISRILALPIIAITILAFTLRTKKVNFPSVKLEKQITVIIDAGHGIMDNGKPNGAIVDNVSEDAIVLAIANKIKELNSNDKLKIVLTRASDQIIDLHKRVDIAKENHADLFVSLHLNAASDAYKDSVGMNGMEVMVSNKNTVYQKESELFGSVLQQELNAIYPVKPSLIKRKVGVWVLDQNVCPSVLVECGFLTDEKDRAFVTKENNQTAIAEKVLKAIERYASNQETNQKNNSDTIPGKQNNPVTNKKASVPKGSSIVNMKVKSKNPPLYILDGKEINESEMKNMNIDPETIESINVLKGDTATKKYGEKATNGVLEIKLKQQKSNKEVNFQENGKTLATGKIKIDPETNEIHGTFHTSGKQADDTTLKAGPLFTKVEIEAAVDTDEWTKFLQKNLQSIIEQAAAKGAQPGAYTVKVKFIVKKDGSMSDFKALNDPGYGLADRLVAMMKNSPKWHPGLQNGKPVNSYHTQPITFVIQ